MQPRPYSLHVEQSILDDLRVRLRRARLPPEPGAGWRQGTSSGYLRDLIAWWTCGYDWREQEARLNSFSQFKCQIEGVDLHFVHEKSKAGKPVPIVLLHGWPDSCFRYRKVIPLLTRAKEGLSFDVVAPSLPGFPLTGGAPISNRRTASVVHRLMTEVLGHPRFVVAGGDGGSAIGQLLALDHPDRVLALHLTDIGWHATAVDPSSVSWSERRYLKRSGKSFMKDGAYAMVQATRPRSLAPALNDSPVALASWIADRFHSWSDAGGKLAFDQDEVLTDVMLYWVTQTIGSSMLSYALEARAPSLTPRDHVHRPVSVALFPKDAGDPPPRKLAERTLDVERWTAMPRGGHFAALEEPELYTRDLIETIRNLH